MPVEELVVVIICKLFKVYLRLKFSKLIYLSDGTKKNIFCFFSSKVIEPVAIYLFLLKCVLK